MHDEVLLCNTTDIATQPWSMTARIQENHYLLQNKLKIYSYMAMYVLQKIVTS